MNDASPIAQAAPLDYATPQPMRRTSIARLIVGLVAALLVSIGSGLVAFGLMMANGVREQSATFTSFGVGLIVMGTGVVASWLFARPR